jgi:AsmA protein
MRFLRIVLTIVVLLAAGVVALPFVVPPEVITDQIVRVTKQQTGRDLTLGGDTSFSLFPDLAVSMNDITISNPPGMPDGVVIVAETLRVTLALAPLLKGDVQVRRFELVSPRFNLLTDGEGRSNWELGTGEAASGRGDRQDAAGPESGSSYATVRSVSLDDIRIVDGIVRYLDESTGTALELEKLNVSVSLPSLDGDLSVDGSLAWQGDTVSIAAIVGPVAQFTDEKTANVRVNLTGSHLEALFDGTVSLADGLQLTGNVEASSPSLRGLAQWAGSPLAPGAGLEAFEVVAHLDLTEDTIALSDAQFGLDGMRAQGSAIIATGGARPQISANLGVDRIDLNQYVAADGDGGGGTPGGNSGSGDWSDAPIDFAGLRAVDATLRLAARQLVYDKVTTADVQASVTIAAGKLDARLEQISLYDGVATGFIQLEERNGAAAVTAGLDADRVAAHPFLKDFAEFDWIEGTSKMVVRVTAAGNSQRALVGSLNGTTELVFTDGAIRGINIAAMMRDMTTQIFSGWERSAAQKTDFAELSATYQIVQGVATNTDLRMLGPLVRLTGAGTVHLPNRYLDYRIEPKLVASLQGQGGAADLTGFNVPIIVKGPWSKPDIYPDIAGILQNPQEALKQLEMIGGLAPGTLGDTVNDVVDEDTLREVEDAVGDALGDDDGKAVRDFLQGLTGGSN